MRCLNLKWSICIVSALLVTGLFTVGAQIATVEVEPAEPPAVGPASHTLDQQAAELRQRLFSGDRHDVMVMAHRGHWREAPENSMLAFELAVEAGIPMLEIDVRMTKDREIVVIHDKTLERTTNGTGRVSHHTLDELDELRLKNGYGLGTDQHIPSLREVMLAFHGRALVYIDKSEYMIPDVVAVLEDTGTLDTGIFYGSRSIAELRSEIGELADRITYIPKLDTSREDPFEYLAAFLSMPNVPAIVVTFREDHPLVAKIMQRVLDAGKRVYVAPLWDSMSAGRTDDKAVRDPDAVWGWLIDQGASIICTDRPARLMRYLEGRSTDIE